jgi:hypothetical protein
MADALYSPAKERALTNAGIQWSTGDIKAILVKITGAGENYTFSAAHEFRSSLHNDTQVATSGNLASKSVTGGVANAANVTFTAVTGAACGAIVLFRDTGNAATDELIAYIDSATGLPVTPNGGDITIEWNTGANKIFAL